MLATILTVTFVISAAIAQNGNDTSTACATNEEFKECRSTCEPHCRNPRPQVCSLECVSGCQCKEGFLRNDQNECVEDCDNASSNICSVNEEFKHCGSACEPSCENPRPEMCTMQCLVNVCQCKDGFFRNSQNQCVSNCSESQEICGVNEELKRCGTACEPTCHQPIRSCTKDCVPNVCQCKQGFLRDVNNTCIPEQDCPRNITCGSNEEVKKCGTACEPTCADPIPKCTKQCVGTVCQCRDGFIRDSSGTCIPEEACPRSSPIVQESSTVRA